MTIVGEGRGRGRGEGEQKQETPREIKKKATYETFDHCPPDAEIMRTRAYACGTKPRKNAAGML